MPCQLRVPDLVAPRAEVAGPLHSTQEVRVAKPPAIEEHGLVDDVGAGTHGVQRGVSLTRDSFGVRVSLLRCDLGDRDAFSGQLFEEASFVLKSALRDAVEHRVSAHRPGEVALEGSALEVREVPALKESDEVRRRVDQLPIDQLHGTASPGRIEPHRSAVC